METFRKEKEEAHRKQIKIRKDDYATKCDFNFIMSHNRKVSHHRLQSELMNKITYFDSRLFTKYQILAICNAYKIKAKKSDKKSVLAKQLGEGILASCNPGKFGTDSESSGILQQSHNIPHSYNTIWCEIVVPYCITTVWCIVRLLYHIVL